jgi:hypothetical protein
MTYQGYLIANFDTGFDRERQPWLLPDDAQFELFDGFVYRGVWQKREGYSQFATGQRGGAPYCESRMIHTVTGFATVGAINSSNRVFTASLTVPVNQAIRRGSVTVVGTVPVQSFTDNGLGYFVLPAINISTITQANPAQVTTTVNHGFTTGDQVFISGVSGMTSVNSPNPYTITVTGLNTFTLDGFDSSSLPAYVSGGTVIKLIGTVNYMTGAVSITLPTAPTAGSVTVTYSLHQGFPVMGVMNFYTQQNTRELIVADTTYVNRYNSVTNRLDDISPAVLLSGDKTNFMSWVNYPTPQNLQRLLFVNFKDPVQQYSGSTVTPYPIYTASVQVTAAAFGTGDGTPGPYNFTTPANTGIVPGTVTITATAQVVTDDQFGVLKGDGTGTVNYLTGAISVTFNANVAGASAITITYKQLNTPIKTALHIFQFKDRLVVEYTIEGVSDTQFGHRIRISGTGAFGDVFTQDAIGAGVIDIPADTFISSSDFNRDDLLIFLKQETWVMKYTQNDVVPFVLDRLDGSRGSEAPYGTITYLNRTNALSPLGLIITDWYSVERADDKIPDYSFNEIDSDNFNLCFAGSVDKDRDHYLIHPSMGETKSDRILITNYEEDNYSIYRIPLSCMGNYIVSFDVTWNDLTIYQTWDEMASVYGNWNAFAFSKGAPISIGGGHEGQIVRLNDIETEDYPVLIRNITVVDSETIQVTTDFQNFEVGDFIALEAISGMVEANNKQYELITVVSPYVMNLKVAAGVDATAFSAYINNGVASKCIVFDCKTKKFNPFANADKKVSCGWLYFYVSTAGTDLTVNELIEDASQADPCVLNVPGHGYTTGTQVFVNGVQGMVELNGNFYYITVIDSDNFSLDGVDATGFTAYSSGGFTSTPQNAILQVRCISNDTEQSTQVYPYNPAPYQVNLSNQESENGIKKWYKLWINQTARFVQFQVINNQSGAVVQLHAMMPGFAPVGRLI